VEEEGRAEGAGERLDVGEVVAVVVRDDDGVDAPGEEIGAENRAGGREDARAEAGVDDDASAVVGLESMALPDEPLLRTNTRTGARR